MEKTEEQIQCEIDRASEIKYSIGTKWRGMTYEDGVIAALEWSLGNREEAPCDDD